MSVFRKILAACALCLGVAVLLAPAVFASQAAAREQVPAPGLRPLAQETTCVEGELCEPGTDGNQPGFNAPTLTRDQIADPKGATVRTIIMLLFMAFGFTYYVRRTLGARSRSS